MFVCSFLHEADSMQRMTIISTYTVFSICTEGNVEHCVFKRYNILSIKFVVISIANYRQTMV